MIHNLRVPTAAKIVRRIQEAPDIFTLRLHLTDPAAQALLSTQPGQFNMLGVFGVGEVPISLKSVYSDGADTPLLEHTIRAVGRVTRALAKLQPGDQISIRGPFGHGWPLAAAQGQDVCVITGGLGCAPAISVIEHLLARREAFGRIHIIQGVRHSDDLIWRTRYEAWARQPDTEVRLAADIATPDWPWFSGRATELINSLTLQPEQTRVYCCGPEPMMQTCAEQLIHKGVAADAIWLSLERNMQCATGHCGHCQFGADFICREGPVFCYPHIRDRLGLRGV